ALLHDDQLFAADLDVGARPFAEDHLVADLDVERMQPSVLAPRPGAGGDDFALHRLLLGGVRNDDAALAARLLLQATDHHAVMQRLQLHRASLDGRVSDGRDDSGGGVSASTREALAEAPDVSAVQADGDVRDAVRVASPHHLAM